jgi:hypothetical protein
MTKYISIVVGIMVLIGLYLNFSSPVLAGTSTIASMHCDVTSTVKAVIGDDLSATLLATSSRRAWARITRVVDVNSIATSTPFLSFYQGAVATINSGIVLSTTTPFIEFGLNSDFPYIGTVTGILVGAASTTVQITECVY